MQKIDLDRFMTWACFILLLGMMICVVVHTIHKVEQDHVNEPANKIEELQDGSFFPTDGERFLKIDSGDVCGHAATVYADSITGVMYIYVGGYGSFCPLYNEDGSLMIYDPSEEMVDVEFD